MQYYIEWEHITSYFNDESPYPMIRDIEEPRASTDPINFDFWNTMLTFNPAFDIPQIEQQSSLVLTALTLKTPESDSSTVPVIPHSVHVYGTYLGRLFQYFLAKPIRDISQTNIITKSIQKLFLTMVGDPIYISQSLEYKTYLYNKYLILFGILPDWNSFIEVYKSMVYNGLPKPDLYTYDILFSYITIIPEQERGYYFNSFYVILSGSMFKNLDDLLYYKIFKAIPNIPVKQLNEGMISNIFDEYLVLKLERNPRTFNAAIKAYNYIDSRINIMQFRQMNKLLCPKNKGTSSQRSTSGATERSRDSSN